MNHPSVVIMSFNKNCLVSDKKLYNQELVNIVKQMLLLKSYKTDNEILARTKMEFDAWGCGFDSKTMDQLREAFLISNNWVLCKKRLENTFYSCDKLDNLVLLSVLEKYNNILLCTENVRLQVYLVGDSQLCKQCFVKLYNQECEPHINSECNIDPKSAYFFACSYICDYCLENKMYIKCF